jgi:hypothetical protein
MKQYNYEAMHQACLNWCMDKNRVWPDFLSCCEAIVCNGSAYIRDSDKDGLIGIDTNFGDCDKYAILTFAKFIGLDLSQFEIKPMTKMEAVKDYLKDFNIGDEIVGGIQIVNNGFMMKGEFVSLSWIDSKAIAEWNYAMLFHALKLDTHEKYKDAV